MACFSVSVGFIDIHFHTEIMKFFNSNSEIVNFQMMLADKIPLFDFENQKYDLYNIYVKLHTF